MGLSYSAKYVNANANAKGPMDSSVMSMKTTQVWI